MKMLPVIGRCTGHCCRRFPLPFSLPEIQANPGNFWEGHKLAAMLLPIQGPQRGLVNNLYTCRHLRDNGDCGNYHDRPRMCHAHGLEYKCAEPECTLAVGPMTVAQSVLD